VLEPTAVVLTQVEVVLPVLQGEPAAGNVLIAWVVVSIFSVNGLNNFDSDCCAVISPTLSSIESCKICSTCLDQLLY
jgi:hypothetical protein